MISTKNDYINYLVLKFARIADLKDNRTLDVIIKLDTLILDFENEVIYISLTRNQDVKFRLK